MSFDFEFDEYEDESRGLDGYFDDGGEAELRRLAADSTRRARSRLEGREVDPSGGRSDDLRVQTATEDAPDRVKVSSLEDLDKFVRLSGNVFVRTGGGDELVRESEKDLWALEETDEGLVVERLFDENGDPIKA